MVRRRRLSLPSYLSAQHALHHCTMDLVVAFHDCDPMGVMWHGNYLAYCEHARHQLGASLDWSIARMAKAGLMAPVVRSQVLHFAPARPEQTISVWVGLYPTEQPRLYHHYLLTHGDQLLAEAETEQVFVDQEFRVVLTQPPELARLLRVQP